MARWMVCAGWNMPHGVHACAGVLAEEPHHVLLPGAGRLHATLMALEERCASVCMLSTGDFQVAGFSGK